MRVAWSGVCRRLGPASSPGGGGARNARDAPRPVRPLSRGDRGLLVRAKLAEEPRLEASGSRTLPLISFSNLNHLFWGAKGEQLCHYLGQPGVSLV